MLKKYIFLIVVLLMCLSPAMMIKADIIADESIDQDAEYLKKYDADNSYFEAEEEFLSAEEASVQEEALFETAEARASKRVLGCDVSKWQGEIDWKKAKENGINFAIIRVAYRGRTDGILYDDNMFSNNIKNAIASGIPVGVYIYSEAITTAEAEEEARYLISKIKGYDVTLPVVIDYEGFNSSERIGQANLSKEQHTKIVTAFCETVKRNGYVPMIYGSASYFVTYMDGATLEKSYCIWSAAYSHAPEYYNSVTYDFWQYTDSGNGYYYGMQSEGLDMDYWYDDGTFVKGAYSVCDGEYMISSKLNTNMVMDVQGSSKADGANIQLYISNNTNAQKFDIKYVGDGLYSISNVNSKKMLDIKNNLSKNGTNIQQYTNNSSYAQKWIIKPTGDGYYTFVSPVSNKVIDVAGGQAKNGTNIQLYRCNGSNAQKFKLTLLDKGATIESGLYTIASAKASDMVIDVNGASKSNGANIQLYKKNESNAQKFIVSYIGSGYYNIWSYGSGKAIDVANSNANNGANVQQYESNSTNAQKWIIRVAGDGKFNIISAISGNYIDVKNSSMKNGANIQTYAPNGSMAQKFVFEKVEEVNPYDGTYYIKSKSNSNYAIDISGASKYSEANVQMYKANNTSAQKFRLEYVGNSFYKIININSNSTIDVKNASKSNGANVQQYNDNGTLAQKWLIRKNSDGTVTFVSGASGKVLDVANGKVVNGANVQQYSDNGTNAQKFVLEKCD